jgi:methionine-rich copper-binding protein CopC
MARTRSLRAVLGSILLLALSASTVAAHVVLMSSTPAAGANLQTAPTQVMIMFDHELNPDLSHFTVADASSAAVGTGAVDLTVADRNVMTGAVTITQPGIYTVSYRVAGVDGHQVTGSFSFGYRTNLAIPNPTHAEGPDTAIRPSSRSSAPMLLGWILVAAAAAMTVTRVVANRS